MGDWDPDLYHKFRRYRAEPFEAIMARLEPDPTVRRIVDLGCGTGENTVELARRFAGCTAVGMDSSPAMIDRALKLREGLEPGLRERLSFMPGDIREFNGRHESSGERSCEYEYSMIFSNAALQWLKEHRGIFTRCFEVLASGGRLVVQVPANDHETAQVTLDAMAHEEPWRAALAGVKPPSATVAAPEVYDRMLAEIGFDRIDCHYHTFHHPMTSPAEIVEWCRATVLRRYVDLLEPAAREPFVEALTARLERAYGTRGPLIFNFRRLFIWAHRPAD